jgi:hypothetical protein
MLSRKVVEGKPLAYGRAIVLMNPKVPESAFFVPGWGLARGLLSSTSRFLLSSFWVVSVIKTAQWTRSALGLPDDKRLVIGRQMFQATAGVSGVT